MNLIQNNIIRFERANITPFFNLTMTFFAFFLLIPTSLFKCLGICRLEDDFFAVLEFMTETI